MKGVNTRARVATHTLLLIGVLVSLFPFYWMVVMATNTTEDIYRYPPKLTFGSHLVDNVRRVFDTVETKFIGLP